MKEQKSKNNALTVTYPSQSCALTLIFRPDPRSSGKRERKKERKLGKMNIHYERIELIKTGVGAEVMIISPPSPAIPLLPRRILTIFLHQVGNSDFRSALIYSR